jgi:hypothetical protein
VGKASEKQKRKPKDKRQSERFKETVPRQPHTFQSDASNAALMWRGHRRGATRIASKRMSRDRSAG